MYPAFHSPSFHAHAVDLSVDADTGEVTIHRYVVAQDVGFAMNPTYIEGQIEGGVAQGLGQALSEEIVYEDGRVLNANLTDYKMPTAMDMPRIETILVEHPSLVGPVRRQGSGRAAQHRAAGRGGQRGGQRHGRADHELPITAEKIALARLEQSERLRTGLLLLPSRPVAELVELAVSAERLGYDDFWLADERFFREVYTILGLAAARTSRIRLGPGVTDPYSRHPALTAMAIATLDEISGGRAILGLGAGVSGFRELGIDAARSAVAIREAVSSSADSWPGRR